MFYCNDFVAINYHNFVAINYRNFVAINYHNFVAIMVTTQGDQPKKYLLTYRSLDAMLKSLLMGRMFGISDGLRVNRGAGYTPGGARQQRPI